MQQNSSYSITTKTATTASNTKTIAAVAELTNKKTFFFFCFSTFSLLVHWTLQTVRIFSVNFCCCRCRRCTICFGNFRSFRTSDSLFSTLFSEFYALDYSLYGDGDRYTYFISTHSWQRRTDNKFYIQKMFALKQNFREYQSMHYHNIQCLF